MCWKQVTAGRRHAVQTQRSVSRFGREDAACFLSCKLGTYRHPCLGLLFCYDTSLPRSRTVREKIVDGSVADAVGECLEQTSRLVSDNDSPPPPIRCIDLGLVWAMTTLAECFINARVDLACFHVRYDGGRCFGCPLSNAAQKSPNMDVCGMMYIV